MVYDVLYIYRIFDLLNLIRDSFNFEIKKKIFKRFVVSMDRLSLKIVITVASINDDCGAFGVSMESMPIGVTNNLFK